MWLTQPSILDFPAQVDVGACSWSKEHNPYGLPVIAAKRAAMQLRPKPKPSKRSTEGAAGAEAKQRSRYAPLAVIA
jgi:hypothetical protein